MKKTEIKKTILFFSISFALSILNSSCKKKESSEPTPASSNPTPTVTATYTNAAYNIVMVDMQSTPNNFPGAFGTNRKFIIVADGISVDSMTTGLTTITNLFAARSSYCPTTLDLNLIPHTFKIQTNATHQFLNYYENNILKAKFLLNNAGGIFSVTSVSGAGSTIVPWYPDSCSYLCVLVV